MYIFVIAFTCIICLFICLGIYSLSGKGASLISGYNMKSEKERKKYDEVALCKFMGKMYFVYSVILTLIMVCTLLRNIFEIKGVIKIGTALLIIITALIYIYMNTGNRFKKS